MKKLNNSIDLERQGNDYVVWTEDQAVTPNFKGEFAYIQDKKIYEEILSEFYDHIYDYVSINGIHKFKGYKEMLIKTFIEK